MGFSYPFSIRQSCNQVIRQHSLINNINNYEQNPIPRRTKQKKERINYQSQLTSPGSTPYIRFNSVKKRKRTNPFHHYLQFETALNTPKNKNALKITLKGFAL